MVLIYFILIDTIHYFVNFKWALWNKHVKILILSNSFQAKLPSLWRILSFLCLYLLERLALMSSSKLLIAFRPGFLEMS